MTGDELARHQLDQHEQRLGDVEAGVSELRAEVQSLKSGAVGLRELLVDLKAELRERDERNGAKIGALFERFETLSTTAAEERGRRSAWGQTWKVFTFGVATATGLMAIAVAALAYVL